MNLKWWTLPVVAIVALGAGASVFVAIDEAPPQDPVLAAGDRLAYNVTTGDHTRTYVAEALGEQPFLAADGTVATGMAWRWSRQEINVLEFVQDRVSVLHQVTDFNVSFVDQDPYLPYDETMEFRERGEEIRFPDVHDCLLQRGEGPCVFAPFTTVFGDREDESIPNATWDDDLPMAVSLSWDGGNATLIGFERGLDIAPLDSPPEPAPVTLAAPVPYPDETGVETEFTVAEAIETALRDPYYFYFQQWYDAHPDTYVAWGHLWAEAAVRGAPGPSNEEWRWDLEVTDGSESYPLTVSKQGARTSDGITMLPATAYPLAYNTRLGQHAELPSADEVPPMGRIAELMARSEATVAPELQGLPLTGWSFHLACDDGCRDPGWEVTFERGYEDETLSTSTSTVLIPNHDGARFYADMHGNGTLRWAGGSLFYESREGQIAPLSSPTAPSQPPERDDDGPDTVALMAAPAAAVGVVGIAAAFKFLAPLFSRVRPEQALEHPTRQAMADAVEAEPGIHIGALRRHLGLAPGTFSHHLRKLAETGQVEIRQLGRYKCVFPPGRLSNKDVAMAGVVRSQGARRIVEVLATHPGTGVRELADLTGLDASTVSYHTSRLEKAGSIVATRDGRTKRLRLA